jgi:mannose/fructose/sorbose-specific phosphotransferase system IIA component
MINILLISHGNFADGILHAAELIIGSSDGIQTLDLQREDPIDELRNRIDSALKILYSNSDGVLILVDLLGASPFNQAATVNPDLFPSIEVVTGLNLPMLLEVITNRSSANSLDELSAIAEQAGIDGIKVLNKLKASFS